MANVTIYAEHREILDSLITSGKVSSVAGGTKTGPFKEQRDAYVFAASIALALNRRTSNSSMPSSKKDYTQIRDTVFLGAAGARELAIAVALSNDCNGDDDTIEQSLYQQLSLISDEQLANRLELLDRFAHAGFDWLNKRRADESNIRDLVLSAIDEIDLFKPNTESTQNVRDPLLDMLDMQI